jgi:hypothetical protein
MPVLFVWKEILILMRQSLSLRLGVLLSLWLMLSAFVPAAPVRASAPEIASYQMQVELDTASKQVHGTARISYRNPSQDTLDEVYLRLYLNAFSSADTLWMRESRGTDASGDENSGMRGYEMSPDELGYIDVQSLKLANGTDVLAGSSVDETLMHVPLPQSLEPGQVLELDVQWVSQLPRVFARTGYGGVNDDFFMVGQWYPKMAVYHNGAWDTEPWHGLSEFFNDFGNYDVSITVPQEYVVAATGVASQPENVVDTKKTLHFSAESVTDFAFAASPNFQVHQAESDGASITIYLMPEHADALEEYRKSSVESLAAFNKWFGKFPHNHISVVDVPDEAGGAGGMEYPMLVTGGTLGMPSQIGFISFITSHEIAHEWWPMQTATNEGSDPWLDEGLTEYSSMRYMLEVNKGIGLNSFSLSAEGFERWQYSTAADLPVDRASWEYTANDLAGAVYAKSAIGLLMLERVVGTDAFFAAMSNYLNTYKYQHPSSADFRNSMEQSLKQDLSWLFDGFFGGNGSIDYAVESIANDGSSAIVNRIGEIQAPVDIHVLTASGASRIEQWTGKQSSYVVQANGDPIVTITLDPERKLAGELDTSNNSLSRSVQWGASAGFGGKMLFWLQWFLQHLAFFG